MGLSDAPSPKKRHKPRGKPKGRARGRPGAQTPPRITPAVLTRRGAARIVASVTNDKRTLDEALGASLASELSHLDARDVAFARLIAVTTLRRLGQVNHVLENFLSKPIDHRAPFARAILQTAVAQLLFLDAPAHAVIDVSVQAIKAHKKSQHFSGLTNAVLRRVSEGGAAIIAEQDAATLNTPGWMLERWSATYGRAQALDIAAAHSCEPGLDLTFKNSNAAIPEGMDGVQLSTGSVRIANAGKIDTLPGFEAGDWWVQDAAAALPARLLGDVKAKKVLDLCAAPGGKTAQLCAAGATVTALDNSAKRMKRVRENLSRLGLNAECVVADAITWECDSLFDAVLVDAPCSATGTIRRHPDIPLLKSEADILRLAEQQQAILRSAAARLMPGGRLVFCTCSLEVEEGADQIAAFLAAHGEFAIEPVQASLYSIPDAWVTDEGYLRTLPHFEVPLSESGLTSTGVDGFFAAVLARAG